MNLSEKTHPVLAIAPATNGSALAGDYISMKKTGHVTVEVVITQGHATPPAITLYQATAVAGTSAKVLAKDVEIKYVADAATSDLMVDQTADVDFTPDAELKNKIVLFEIPAEALDMDNDFTCIQVRAAASNAANIISATYWCSEERYHGKSKIVD
jgi:hypothetical protein